MFTTINEQNFFLNELNQTKKVLEYGSGESTIEIASKCEFVVSVEHQKEWYDVLYGKKPENCKLFFCPPNLPYVEGSDCGTYEEFKDYIESPIEDGPYDVILIDGRARVSCASICNKLTNENGIIFIHDFHRQEYQDCLNYLTIIDIVDTMAKFKLKKQ